MNTVTRSVGSLTDGFRTIQDMIRREAAHQQTYCHPELEYPMVQGPSLYISATRPDAHAFDAVVSTGPDTQTFLHVSVIPHHL